MELHLSRGIVFWSVGAAKALVKICWLLSGFRARLRSRSGSWFGLLGYSLLLLLAYLIDSNNFQCFNFKLLLFLVNHISPLD